MASLLPANSRHTLGTISAVISHAWHALNLQLIVCMQHCTALKPFHTGPCMLTSIWQSSSTTCISSSNKVIHVTSGRKTGCWRPWFSGQPHYCKWLYYMVSTFLITQSLLSHFWTSQEINTHILQTYTNAALHINYPWMRPAAVSHHTSHNKIWRLSSTIIRVARIFAAGQCSGAIINLDSFSGTGC